MTNNIEVQDTKLQMNGLVGLKSLFPKSELNISNTKIFVIFKILVMVTLEKFIVQIGKILIGILH